MPSKDELVVFGIGLAIAAAMGLAAGYFILGRL